MLNRSGGIPVGNETLSALLRQELRPALVALALLTIVTGVIYPLAVTGVARMAFARQAEGSLIQVEGQTMGSELIGQPFTRPAYFWPRVSATSPAPYNAAASSGSNLGPTNPALAQAVAARAAALEAANPAGVSAESLGPIPIELVTASGSGLDPEISPEGALWQAPRVAAARGLPVEQVQALIHELTQRRTLGLFGEPRVNVLLLNQALDKLAR